MIPFVRQLSSLMGELKRRHVFRVAIVYAGVAWLVVQIADTWLSALPGVPAWTVTFVVVLASLGFPIALVLAWALEITPGGITLTPPLDASETPVSQTVQAASPAPAVRPAERSIAVLPFANLSADQENEYLSDGISEELLNALGQIHDLRVASRTSTSAYKGRGEDVRQIGAFLGVSTVLEGSIRRAGNKLRIRAQLTEVANGYQLWSQMFEREMDDLFALQDEISHSIADSLRVKLPRSGTEFLERRRTQNPEAYQFYLKGRYFWNKRTEAGLRQAVEHFGAAVRLDPDYALAHAGLADSCSLLVDYGYVAPREALAAADAAASRALEIDATLSEAHTSLAIVRQFMWDWSGAARGFRRSIELNQANPIAHHRYALLLTWLGRFDDALGEITTARKLDPTSLIINTTVGWIHYYARQFDRAQEQLSTALAMEPGFPPAHLALGLVMGQLGRHDDAIHEFQTAIAHGGETPSLLGLLAHAYGRAGKMVEAREPLERLAAMGDQRYVPPFYRAIAAIGLGEREHALTWLEQAFADRSNHLAYLATDPQLDDLRDDPRLQQLLSKVGLSQGPAAAVLAAPVLVNPLS